AAGSSSRFKPISDNRHKGLTSLLGKPIVEHTIEELQNIGIDDVVVIQGPEKRFEDEVDAEASFRVQEEPRGMGHALNQARDLLDEKFLVLNPYHAPSAHIIEELVEKARQEGSETAFVSRETESPEDYGILDLEERKAVGVTEKPDPDEAPSNRRIVGMYLLSPDFFSHLDAVEEWEYQFEDALDRKVSGDPASVLFIDEETISIKYPWDLFEFVEALLDERGQAVSDGAEVAETAVIEGDVIVEEGARIFENAVVKGPAYIGRDAVVGNNALVRDHVSLEERVVIGTGAEVKNSVFQPGSSLHSGYIGDSVVGKETKIGAETVTANRKFRRDGDRPEIASDLIAKGREQESGKSSLGAFIGDEVDIGVNVSLMPGVQVGSEAEIGPGTVVERNVQNGETVYVDQEKVRKE
ncbi:MAG: sugar phosphate nucleotidyltransferase, partial [Candidatus Nanohaloarchaea archaeon]